MYTGHRKMAVDTRIKATAMKNLEPRRRKVAVKEKLNPFDVVMSQFLHSGGQIQIQSKQ